MKMYGVVQNETLVAEVCEFSDGQAAVRWFGWFGTTATHESMDSVRSVHIKGHNGRRLLPWEEAWFLCTTGPHVVCDHKVCGAPHCEQTATEVDGRCWECGS